MTTHCHPIAATPSDGVPPAGPTLLIVDDSAMMRLLLRRAALATGVPLGDILEAANGEEALAVLESRPVDALFTDITMPVMNGLQLLHRLAADPRFAGLTRVVISTDGSSASRREADALAVSQYVTKPFAPEVMRVVLAALARPE